MRDALSFTFNVERLNGQLRKTSKLILLVFQKHIETYVYFLQLVMLIAV